MKTISVLPFLFLFSCSAFSEMADSQSESLHGENLTANPYLSSLNKPLDYLSKGIMTISKSGRANDQSDQDNSDQDQLGLCIPNGQRSEDPDDIVNGI